MSTRRKMLLSLPPLLVLLILVVRSATPEPRYGGQNLSQWIAMYERPPGGALAPQERRDRVDQAVRAMGTNAIPYLLRWYAYDNTFRTGAAEGMSNMIPATLRTNRNVTRLLSTDPKERRAYCALVALAAMDPDTLHSSPDFIRFMTTTNTAAEWYNTVKLRVSLNEIRRKASEAPQVPRPAPPQ